MNENGYPEGWPPPLFLECECYSDEHVLKWSLDDDPDWPALYTSVFLNNYRNVFKRMWIAVKYTELAICDLTNVPICGRIYP